MKVYVSRWSFLFGLVTFCGLLVWQLGALRSTSENSRNLAMHLSRTSELMAKFEAAEMEALYGPGAERWQALSEMDSAHAAFAANLRDLRTYDRPDLDVDPVIAASVEYDETATQIDSYLRAGDVQGATQVDNSLSDPAYERLSSQIVVVSSLAQQRAEQSIHAANLRLTALALIGAGLVCALFYVDAKRRAQASEQKALAYSETRFRLLTERASDVLLIVDTGGMIRYASPSIQAVLGITPERACGQSLLELVFPDDRPLVSGHLTSAKQGQSGRVEFRGLLHESEWVYLEATLRDLSSSKEIGGLVINLRDIDDQKRAQTQLLHTALHDSLTGLANRLMFTERLQTALERAARDDKHCVAVLFIDIDDFKVINDSVGHYIGDLLILEMAQRIINSLRRSDTVSRLHSSTGLVARFGGDEFVVMLDEVHNADDAVRVCERIHTAMRQPFLLSGGQFYASVSIGVAVSEPQCTAEDLMRDADVAMYRAKTRGKARYAIFDSRMHEHVSARLRLETDLRLALQKNEFMLHYQPIICLKTGRIRRVEALLRWNRNGTIVLPGEFIGAAEESGLIRPIGDWALREACRQTALWNQDATEPVIVCVNISGKQFTHVSFLDEVMAAIADSGVFPQHLEFEITEGVAMEDAERTRYTLSQLRALGVQLALDDFGTGYSSLSYLRRFAVNTLKIDRSFVSDLPRNRENLAIVQTIIALANILGLETVAEGIETADQLRTLQTFGCGLGQGFLLVRPEPPNLPPWPQGTLVQAKLLAPGAVDEVQEEVAVVAGS